jgi:phosphonopyruvate decarboxylase
MIAAKAFGDRLHRLGFSLFTGVPCSFLQSLINYAVNDCEYIGAANEGDAVAIAAGAWIGGRKPVVLMQNSGLTNAVSPLVSLNFPFRIPVLGFVSLRGEPGLKDEPQHELMGQMTTQLLDLMRVEWQYLSADPAQADNQLGEAAAAIDADRPFFFVVRKGTFADEPLREVKRRYTCNERKMPKQGEDERPSRREALAVINSLKDSRTILLATTGKTGRELYELEDGDGNLYMVGSMGCAASMGFGLALARPDKAVVVIDGDGSLLMRMGSLATVGCFGPPNLLHILLDNQSHDSTGGQSTVSHNVDFVEIAASCGYRRSIYAHNRKELEQAIRSWQQGQTLTFLHLKISGGSKDRLGRPQIRPHEVKERLIGYLNRRREQGSGTESCEP